VAESLQACLIGEINGRKERQVEHELVISIWAWKLRCFSWIKLTIMEIPHSMNTVSEILEKLRKKKMCNEFRCHINGFTVNEMKFYPPASLTIIKTYRFEGITDPADESIIYIIEAEDGLVGYSLDSYGIYNDHNEDGDYNNFIRNIKIKDHADQLLFTL
jgi:hypothetical protein